MCSAHAYLYPSLSTYVQKINFYKAKLIYVSSIIFCCKFYIHDFIITKTCLCNFDPLKPHFYIVKLGFPGVYIIFLISAQKHRLWVLVRTAEAVLTSTHNLCFKQKYEKYQGFLSENFQFLEVKLSVYLNRRVFVMSRICDPLAMAGWQGQIYFLVSSFHPKICMGYVFVETKRKIFCG